MKKVIFYLLMILMLANLAACTICHASTGKFQPKQKKETTQTVTASTPKAKASNTKYWVLAALFKG